MKFLKFIIILSLLIPSLVNATGNFIKIDLPHDTTLEIPKNWVVFSENSRITLDSSIEARLALAKIKQNKSDLPFAANCYGDNGKIIGKINIRYYSHYDISQTDIQNATDTEIAIIDDALREGKEKAFKLFKSSNLISWVKTYKKNINGAFALVSEYRRTPQEKIESGVFRVRLVKIFTRNYSFTLTISYDESESLLEAITDRIIYSLNIQCNNEKYTEVILPKCICLSVPSSWVIVSNEKVLGRDLTKGSKCDLSKIKLDKSMCPLAAFYVKDKKSLGSAIITYNPEIKITQLDVQNATIEEIKPSENAFKAGRIKSLGLKGQSILSWKDPVKKIINDVHVIITEYQKLIKNDGPYNVRVVKIFLGDCLFSLTVEHKESINSLWPIANKIIESLTTCEDKN